MDQGRPAEPLTEKVATGNGVASTRDLIWVQDFLAGQIERSERRQVHQIEQSEERQIGRTEELKKEFRLYKDRHDERHNDLKKWIAEQLKPINAHLNEAHDIKVVRQSYMDVLRSLWANRVNIIAVLVMVFIGSGIADFSLDILTHFGIIPGK